MAPYDPYETSPGTSAYHERLPCTFDRPRGERSIRRGRFRDQIRRLRVEYDKELRKGDGALLQQVEKGIADPFRLIY